VHKVRLLRRRFKVKTICRTTLLRPRGGPGGVFDPPSAKCPPDRGSSGCVTGNPAPMLPINPAQIPWSANAVLPPSLSGAHRPPPPFEAARHGSRPTHIPNNYPNYPGPIPINGVPPQYGYGQAPSIPPPHIPQAGMGNDGRANTRSRKKKDALDFLLTIFPSDGFSALQFARSVAISAPNMAATFDGVVLELPGKPKTLYVDGKGAEAVSLRESIMTLLDLADDALECQALVIVLERSSPALNQVMRSLMRVGGTVVKKPPFNVDAAYILVGISIF